MTNRRRAVEERLRWLIDVMRSTAQDRAGERYSDAELAAYLANALGADPAVTREVLARAYAGEAVPVDVLNAIADLFDIPRAFFGHDLAHVDAIRDTILDRALTARGVRAWLICRMAVPHRERRRQLRSALTALRPTPPDTRWHDDDHSDDHSRHDGGAMKDPTATGAVREMCRDLVQELELTGPFEPEEVCERLGIRRGRRITIRAVDLGGTTGVGHLVRTRNVDRILVDHCSPRAQRDLVIYHEVVHLVRDHLDGAETMSCGLVGTGASLGDREPRDWREREAEVGARTLAALARQRPLPNRLRGGASPEDVAIGPAFGFAEAP